MTLTEAKQLKKTDGDVRLPPDLHELISQLQKRYAVAVSEATKEASARVAEGQLSERTKRAWIGTIASNSWSKRVANHDEFKNDVLSVDTGVTTHRGGRIRFNLVLRRGGRKLFFEAQTSDYSGGHKPRQLTGQMLALAEGTVRNSMHDYYVKLFGDRAGGRRFTVFGMQALKEPR